MPEFEKVLTPDADGIFTSPLGKISPDEIEWKSMKDYVTHIFTTKHPRSCIVEPQTDRKISYHQLFKSAGNLAKDFREQGIEPGTIVHMVGENRIKWLVVLLAGYVNSYVISASHPVSPWPEIERNVKTTCSTVLVLTQTCYQKYTATISSPYLTHVFAVDDDAEGENYKASLKTFPQEQSLQPQFDPKELDGVCSLLLSSGTTGVPKAVKLRDTELTANCIISNDKGVLNIDNTSNMPLVQPLAHGGGLVLGFLAPALVGANIFVLDYPGSVGLLEMVQKYAITHIFAMPPVLNFLAKYEHLEKYDLSSVKYILSGGTSVNFDSIRTIIKRSGNNNIKMKNVYGATETCGLTFGTHDFHDTILESIGIPLRGVRFKINSLDNEDDVITKPNQEGEMVLKTDLGFALYFNDPKKTEENLTRDGKFYKSGDVVYLDERNNLFVSGRIKDVVKFRGFSVSPAEIEDILMSNPMIGDCAVLGEKSEEHGEIPVAFIVPSPEGEKEKEERLKTRMIKFVEDNIANHKKIHKVYTIDKIPRSESGKILKRELRKLIE